MTMDLNTVTPAKKRAVLAKLLVERAGPVRSAPLSFAQERLWFLEQLQPGNTAYLLPLVLRLREPVDAGALARAIDAIVARHEALRTTFAVVNGVPMQRIASRLSIPLQELDFRSAPDGMAELRRTLAEDATEPFDLQRGPLLRAKLLHGPAGETTLVVTTHHIVSDGWSCGVLTRELTAIYSAIARGDLASLPSLPIQYADFAIWQREWLRGETLRKQVDYWKSQLQMRHCCLIYQPITHGP